MSEPEDELEQRRKASRQSLDDAHLRLSGKERAFEVKLEARLYDAFMKLPTLKAKKAAVETLEGWAWLDAQQKDDKGA